MAVYVNINGVIYELSGIVSTTPVASPMPSPSIPARTNSETTVPMTAASSGGFTASATSEYSEAGTTAAAWRAFNGVFGAGWAVGWSSNARATAAAPQRLEIEIPIAKPVYSYGLTNRADANTLAPLAWVFEGWDGNAWQLLHSVSGASWANGEAKTFDTTAQGVFSRYRWSFTDSGPLCQVAEAKLWA